MTLFRAFLVLLLFTSMPAAAQEGTGESTPDPLEAFANSLAPRNDVRWAPSFSAGFDALLHTYPLATTDTTETISESFVAASLEGRSGRSGPHRWRLRGELSAGSELFRQELSGQWKYRDPREVTRWWVDADLRGRQYRAGTEYSLSSDNLEGDLAARFTPWAGDDHQVELRADGGFLEYGTPSSLEVSHRERGLGVQLGSRLLADSPWRVGYRFMRRAYPDSAGIDRATHSLEGDLELQDLEGRTLRLYHRTSRREIRNEDLKPSAWTHWSDLAAKVPAGVGSVYLDLQSEVWSYDEESAVYLDSWLLDGVLGYQWGDLMSAGWRLGLAAEHLAAGDSPETYTQLGLRAGLESYGASLNGSVQVEYGRRIYAQENQQEAWPAFPGDDFADLDLTYSDFQYFEIWVMGGWNIHPRLRLDIMASYEPESHTETEDDTSLGYASLRLVYSP